MLKLTFFSIYAIISVDFTEIRVSGWSPFVFITKGGKSGLLPPRFYKLEREKGWWVTPTRGNPTESAAETILPLPSFEL